MPQIYLSNELYRTIVAKGKDPTQFVREAVQEKLGKAK